MKPVLRFVCPKCGEKFPFWLGPSNRIRNGFLSTPWLKCSHCGAVSRISASWPNALWAWPLAFFTVTSVIALFQNTDPLVILHRHHPGVYGALGGLSMGLCFFIIRFGLKLTPLFGESEIRSGWGAKTWLKALLVTGVVVAVALATHRWTATLVSFAMCLVVSGVFYLFSRKKKVKSVEPTSACDGVPAAHDS